MSEGVTETRSLLATRLLERLAARDLSPRGLSLRIGANASYVSQLINGKGGTPSAERLRQMAAELDTTTDWLIGRVDTPVQPLSEVSGFSDVRLTWRGQTEAAGPRIPVLGTGHCTDLEISGDGAVVLVEQALFEPDHAVATIERPPALLGATDAYAIHYRGSSMEPVFTQGQIGVVDPRRVARPGDDVIVQLNDGASHTVVTVLVKRLVRETSRYVELEQFNPPVTFRVPRERVERLHRLLTVGDLLGG